MRIHNILVEQFGAWHNQDVALSRCGLVVLYGPNEAGKSTLMRFVRRLLYGFRPEDEAGPGARPRRFACAGRLEISGAGGAYVLRRESEFGTRGRVALTHETQGPVSAEVLCELLSGVSEQAYEQIFAVGLDELQQLATLQGEDAGRHIFDMTLGRRGEQIVAACRSSEEFRRQLWDETRDAGEIRAVVRELEEIERQLTALGDPLAEFHRLRNDGQRIETEIVDQKRRLHGLQEQLRGHLFLERVWGPWHRQRQLQEQRAALNVRGEFPAEGVPRLEQLSREIAEGRRLRCESRREARESARLASELVVDERLDAHASRVRWLLERSASMEAIKSGLGGRKRQADEHRRAMVERQARLGSGWSEQRLGAVDASPAAASRLCARAQTYRLALVRRSQYTRKYQRLAAEVQQEQAEHAEQLRAFGGRDFDEMYEELSNRDAALREAVRLQARVAAGEAAAATWRRHGETAGSPRKLPPYYYAVLGLFGAGGAALMLLGLLKLVHAIPGGPAPWQVGAVFLLLGTCCAAVTWTMKRQFDPPDASPQGLDRSRLAVDAGLSASRRELEVLLARITADTDAGPDGPARDESAIAPLRIEELQVRLRQRLADLGELERCDQALRERRQRLSRMRSRLREFQRAGSGARCSGTSGWMSPCGSHRRSKPGRQSRKLASCSGAGCSTVTQSRATNARSGNLKTQSRAWRGTLIRTTHRFRPRRNGWPVGNAGSTPVRQPARGGASWRARSGPGDARPRGTRVASDN